jgi:hypothetical protein
MRQAQPPAITVLGLSGLLFGLASVAWLALGRRHDMAELLDAAFGDRSAATRLARDRLDGVGALCAALVPLLLEWALAFILIAAGAGLLCFQRSARWTALFYCGCTVPLQAISALLQVVCLTGPTRPASVGPIIVSFLVTVFAIVFCGGLFLPEVVAAYAGQRDRPSTEQARA